MKIGVGLPAARSSRDERIPAWSAVRGFALACEEAGLDSVWMFDHFFNRRDDGTYQEMYESWTILSAVAAITERMRSAAW